MSIWDILDGIGSVNRQTGRAMGIAVVVAMACSPAFCGWMVKHEIHSSQQAVGPITRAYIQSLQQMRAPRPVASPASAPRHADDLSRPLILSVPAQSKR